MPKVANAKELALLLAGVEIGREFKLFHETDGIGGMHFESECGKYTGGLWHAGGVIALGFDGGDDSLIPNYALQHIYTRAESTAGELWRRWENAAAESEARKNEGGEA